VACRSLVGLGKEGTKLSARLRSVLIPTGYTPPFAS
jgi:hypothetical protein